MYSIAPACMPAFKFVIAILARTRSLLTQLVGGSIVSGVTPVSIVLYISWIRACANAPADTDPCGNESSWLSALPTDLVQPELSPTAILSIILLIRLCTVRVV